MAKSFRKLAAKLLENGVEGLEEVRVHEFANDEDAHDVKLIERLYKEFASDFDRLQIELTTDYGQPSRTGLEDDDNIPLNGVFQYAVWDVGDLILYLAAAHEDRGLPILLMVGTADRSNV